MEQILCTFCNSTHTYIQTENTTAYGNPIIIDDLGRKWRIYWSSDNKIRARKCPDCYLKGKRQRKTEKQTTRKCRGCNKPLKKDRYFNCYRCVTYVQRGKTDDDYIYHGYWTPPHVAEELDNYEYLNELGDPYKKPGEEYKK